jgi:hypothetical protein
MEREYTYAELCRMKKKRVIRIAGYKNIKALLRDNLNRTMQMGVGGKPYPTYENVSKKWLARLIACDR